VTRGRRLFVAAGIALAAAVLSAAPVQASPGGPCEGYVDFDCRAYHCQEDELDCGLIPPCMIWFAGTCLTS
jgi:hypothetical protein